MDKIIQEYQLSVPVRHSNQIVSLPVGAQVLNVLVLYGTLTLICLIDPNEKKLADRVIELYRSGEAIRYDMGVSRRYISSFESKEEVGAFPRIFHAFEYGVEN
jgi:hypothetical protein